MNRDLSVEEPVMERSACISAERTRPACSKNSKKVSLAEAVEIWWAISGRYKSKWDQTV